MTKSKPAKQTKILHGIALGNSKDKTVTVEVPLIKIHPKYHKRYKVYKKYLVHTDKEIKAKEKVIIFATRPLSKRKTWQVKEKV